MKINLKLNLVQFLEGKETCLYMLLNFWRGSIHMKNKFSSVWGRLYSARRSWVVPHCEKSCLTETQPQKSFDDGNLFSSKGLSSEKTMLKIAWANGNMWKSDESNKVLILSFCSILLSLHVAWHEIECYKRQKGINNASTSQTAR